MELGRVEIQLNSQPYKLARREVIKLAGLTARNWQMERLPVATKREPRSNVRPGAIPGEWIITYDDWSKGITGDHTPIPGTYHYGRALDATTPGAVRPTGPQNTFTN